MALFFASGLFDGHISWENTFTKRSLLAFAYIFLYIAAIWNSNIALINLSIKNLSWETQFRTILLRVGAFALLLPVFWFFVFNQGVFPVMFNRLCDLNVSYRFLSISVIVTLLVNSILVAIGFFRFWRRSLTEKEALKRSSLTAEFESLKSQINPHFLFNCLNTLTGLIEEHHPSASNYVQKLSNVYRYVLQQKDKETVSLAEEIDFIRAYIYLNEIRFGENLQTRIEIPDRYLNRQIATLTLQMLVENAIKHNIISAERPLQIHIGIEKEMIFVSNNLQRKKVINGSNHIGLSNIVSRYGFLSETQVIIEETSEHFKVSVPLL